MRSLNSSPAFASPVRDISCEGRPEAADKREWSISEMARDFGLTLRALRFYEAKGLISPQRFGGARYYTPRERARLTLVLNAKRMGFTLSETSDLIGSTRSGDNASEVADLPLSPDAVTSQIAFLENQRQAIDAALGSLRQRQQAMAGTAA